MRIKQVINKVRFVPGSFSFRREFVCSSCVFLLGLVLGIVAKATDGASVIGDIGTLLGVWVFAATIVAAFSRSPFLAALNTLLFFLAMLAAYYTYGQFLLGFFPRSYFLGWLFIALLSPAGGFAVWFSRGRGWFAAISAALPVALLIAEGYSAFYTYQVPLIFDLCCAAVLLTVLPKTWKQKGLASILSIAFAVIVVSLNMLSLLPW